MTAQRSDANDDAVETLSPEVITENIPKKEMILNRAGATRERGARIIADAMDATKMTVDRFGEEHLEIDHTTRLRAEELRAKYTGDIKPDGAMVNIHPMLIVTSAEMKGYIEEARRLRQTDIREQTGEIADVSKYSGN